ncbi:UNVERIFIED_CONTAM: putative enzymatic polyprotein [Sesamum latifolium]|uniref:Enzymatic polyprotein n=1 Tax=Sesamum latifolium TaxID=2727402 RepID=A0AAW2VJN9_9LAMI
MTPTLGVPNEPLSGEDHGGPNPRLEPTNLGKGSDQQGLHPKNLDEQIQDPQDEPLQEELSDGSVPEPMKVSKTVIAGPAEQRVTYLQTARKNVLIPKEEILEELSKLREEVATTMKWIHIGLLRIAYNLADQDFSRVLTLHQDFKRKDLMKEGNRPYSITYRIAYALSNTHHSDLFLRKEYIEIPRIFKEFMKVMTLDPIRIPRIDGVGIVIKDHPVLERTLSTRTEFSSRMSFSEDRITCYKGKEKELIKIFTPQEIRVDNVKLRCPEGWKEIQKPVIGRYEGMLEIAGHEILVAGIVGRENGSMALGLNFFEDHKPWGRKGSGICTAEPEVFPKEAMETLPVIAGRDFSQKILILNKGIREAKIMIGGAFGTPWNKIEATLKVKEECKYEYVRYKPIQMNMEDKKDMQGIIKEHINFGLIEPGVSAYSSPSFLIKMENESKKYTAFSTPQGQYIWNVMPMGLANAPQIFQRKMDNLFKDYFEFIFVYIDDILIASKNMKDHIKHLEIFSDACHREGLVFSDKKATIAVNKIKFLGVLIDETGIELQDHIVEKIHNFLDVLRDKKHLQSFLGVVNFAGIFIKDLAKYRKDFRPLLKKIENSKWKWEEIHTQKVRELKQVCSNLPKLAIPQDEDELVVYTYANDYRWAAVLMKKTTKGEEPCRYTRGLFSEQQAQVWHINEKEFFALWKAFKK